MPSPGHLRVDRKDRSSIRHLTVHSTLKFNHQLALIAAREEQVDAFNGAFESLQLVGAILDLAGH